MDAINVEKAFDEIAGKVFRGTKWTAGDGRNPSKDLKGINKRTVWAIYHHGGHYDEVEVQVDDKKVASLTHGQMVMVVGKVVKVGHDKGYSGTQENTGMWAIVKR